MKVKENKGISLVTFTIILAVLVVVAGVIIVYLLKSPVKENLATQNQINIEKVETNNLKDLNNITKATLEQYISKFYYVKNFDEITKENIDTLMCFAILDNQSKSLIWNGEELGLANQNILKQLIAEKIECSVNSLPNSETFIEGDSLSSTENITQWPFVDGDAEQFIGYITEVNKIEDIGNNKLEVTALQVAYNLAIGVLEEEGELNICLSADQSEKTVASKIAKNDMNSYKLNNGGKCAKLVKEFAEKNGIGYRTFTIEILDNNNNSSYENFKLISIKEDKEIQNSENEEIKSNIETKEEYTNNLADAKNGETAFLTVVNNKELQTEKHNGYYTYIDPFENKYNIKEIKNIVSQKGIISTDNGAALFEVTVTYIDNNNKSKKMNLAVLLLKDHEVQIHGNYEDYTGTTSFSKLFLDEYED